jgi:hypothetical protein
MHCDLNKGMLFGVYKSDHPDAPQQHTFIVISNQKDSFDGACHILSHNNFGMVYFKESHAVINFNIKFTFSSLCCFFREPTN